jgi:hypothetical protein
MVDYGFIMHFRVVNAYFCLFCGGFMGFSYRWSNILSYWYSSWSLPMAKLKKIEVTQWFRYEDVPVRYGVYEVNPHSQLSHEERQMMIRMARIAGNYRFYSYWDGKRWGWICASIDGAYKSRETETAWEVGELPWRGIAGS